MRTAVLFLAVVCLFLAGCESIEEPDRGANQSLVSIGERALEQAMEYEDRGRRGEAVVAYKRALWAFRYHEHLTGEEPFLMGDALEGLERTGAR